MRKALGLWGPISITDPCESYRINKNPSMLLLRIKRLEARVNKLESKLNKKR